MCVYSEGRYLHINVSMEVSSTNEVILAIVAEAVAFVFTLTESVSVCAYVCACVCACVCVQDGITPITVGSGAIKSCSSSSPSTRGSKHKIRTSSVRTRFSLTVTHYLLKVDGLTHYAPTHQLLQSRSYRHDGSTP